MSLPVISSRECIKALAKIGFYESRQTGSHIILRRDEPGDHVLHEEHDHRRSSDVPQGKKRDVHTGRAAVRASGNFRISHMDGISWRYCRVLHDADG